MYIEEFKLERTMSLYQHHVDYDFTETGVNPLHLNELLSREELNDLYENFQLSYIQTDGRPELKEAICHFYENAVPENLLVTNGSAEANFITAWSNIEKGDEIAYMLPNYMLVSGLARSFGAEVRPFELREENDWELDVEDLRKAVTSRTKMICVTNPNNPAGSVLSEEAMREIVNIADSVGAWILSDEVYRGAELNGITTPSFWNRYDKVIVCGGLSKAFAIPGIRVGWMVAPKELVAKGWAYHDYSTICIGALSSLLATKAMQPEKRESILSRNRAIADKNLGILQEWVEKHEGLFSFTPTKAGGFAFIRYNHPINSTELTMNVMKEKSVFIVPGDCFGVDHFFRISFGVEENYLKEGLQRISEYFHGLRK